MGPPPIIELDYRFEKVRLKSRPPSNPIERFGALASQSMSISPSVVPLLPVGRAERIAAGSLDPAWFRAEQVVEPSGEIVRLRAVDHGSKPLVEYAYDGLGRPSEIVLLGNLREKYTWSDEGNLIRISGRDIEATSFSYGDHGLLSRVKYPDGSIFSYSYDAERRLTHITYPDGCQVTRTYNENGQLQSLSTQDARFEFQWDDVRALGAIRFSTAKHSHELICSRSRKSAIFDFTGSEHDTTVTSALGQWSHRNGGATAEMFAFPGERLVRKTDFGDAMVVTWTSSGRSCFRFDRQNCLSSVLNCDGTHTLYVRLISERAVLKVAASGISILYYDPNGRLLAERDRKGIGSAYAVDQRGDLEWVEHQGRRIKVEWDPDKNPRSLWANGEYRASMAHENQLPVRVDLKSLELPVDAAMNRIVGFVWSWHINRRIQRLVDMALREK